MYSNWSGSKVAIKYYGAFPPITFVKRPSLGETSKRNVTSGETCKRKKTFNEMVKDTMTCSQPQLIKW